MAVSPKGLSIQTMYREYRDGRLIVNRQYQRKLVWTVSEKVKLIDSIMLNYPIPLILLAEKSTADGAAAPTLEVIDGMQRLNAIFSFIEPFWISIRISYPIVSRRSIVRSFFTIYDQKIRLDYFVWDNRALFNFVCNLSASFSV